MNTALEIAKYISNHDNFYIIVHKNPDGDCLGSAKALCLALKNMGKSAAVCLPNPLPARLEFFWNPALEARDFACDTALFVDVASFGQMGALYDEIYKSAPHSVCIDHHGTNSGYADLNYIDGKSAAAGELVYEVIRELGCGLNAEMAEALLIAISEDTGCFQYSNTSPKTHRIASELYEIIPNPEPLMRALYSTHTMGEMLALQAIMPSMEFHLGGKVCMVTADIRKLNAMGVEASNVDAWLGLPRSVEGVEAALIFKIHSDNELKLSLRSNDYVDVSALAAKFGGGGHARAAGVTFNEGIESAKAKVLAELKKLV